MSRGGAVGLAMSLALFALQAAGQGAASDDADGRDGGASLSAVEALAAGRRAKGERNLARAESHFQDALVAAERGAKVYQAALEELTYHLPLMRVERYALTGQWQRAEQGLQDLLDQHQDDEEKSRHLVGLIARLRDRAPAQGGVYERRDAGQKAVETVERVLARFLDEHGRYPNGYEELNEILPAGRYPLEDYDIVHYVGRGKAYGLTLRSKNNPANLLSVQKSGLLR